MKMLSRAEEIILLAILKLKNDAYGISIRQLIREETGDEWSFAQIYDPLNKLFSKGYVRKFQGSPTPERGGRPKCLYQITPQGKEVLTELREIQDIIWESVPKKALT
jgi:DNA-binding PadR family transcriptional regulator